MIYAVGPNNVRSGTPDQRAVLQKVGLSPLAEMRARRSVPVFALSGEANSIGSADGSVNAKAGNSREAHWQKSALKNEHGADSDTGIHIFLHQ